jgi:hypothetical protein
MFIVGFLRSKLGRYVGLALAVLLISFGVTQCIQSGATDSLLKDIQLEQIRDDQRVTERTNDAVNEVRRATPDANAARQWLLNRQQ